MNIKLSTIMLASLLALGPAMAADKAPATDKAVDKPAAKSAAGVNPFTGKPLTVEQIQRELEESKLRTQMLEEDLKQTNLQQELTTVPLRKAVEAAQAKTALKREDMSQRDMEETQKAAAAARQAEERERSARVAKAEQELKNAREAAAAAKKTAAKKPPKKSPSAKKGDETDSEDDADVAEKGTRDNKAEQSAPAMIRPVLTSVIDLSGSRSAVLDFAGNTLVVQDGGMTPMGPLKILDLHSVEVNGVVLKVHGATLSRFVVSDPKPVDPLAARNAVAQLPASGLVPAATANKPQGSANDGNSTTPIVAPQRTALPPLQLPPGVSVLPSSTR